jgi:FkbM family methyltransferase
MNKLQTLNQLSQLCGLGSACRVLLAKLVCRKTVYLPLPSSAIRVECRLNNSDLVVFLGTFLHGDSLISMIPRPTVIFDLGANVGFTAIQLARQFPAAKIYAVEPARDSCELCRRNTAGFENVVVLQKAVSTVPGEFILSNSDSIAMSRSFSATACRSSDTVEGVTLAKLLSDHVAPDDVVLIKMDIEGAERDIFDGDATWLHSVGAVLVEPHGDGTAEVIKHAFSRSGFQLDKVGEKLLGLRSGYHLAQVQ